MDNKDIIDQVVRHAVLDEKTNLSNPDPINRAVEAHLALEHAELARRHKTTTEVEPLEQKLVKKYGSALVNEWKVETHQMDNLTEVLFARNKKILDDQNKAAEPPPPKRGFFHDFAIKAVALAMRAAVLVSGQLATLLVRLINGPKK